MRLAVDVMGGDHGPEELLLGVKMGLEADPSIEGLFVVGPESELRVIIDRIGLRDSRLEIRPASEVLTMHDDPAIAVRRKKDSSLMRAIELVREGKAQAVISSGNTGALVAGSTVRLGRLEGVKRPTLACIMPSRSGAWVLVDGGANPECTPEILLQFAVMGSAYARSMLGVERPRVGILSNGTEESKGTQLTRDALALVKQTDLNCIGYCEGHQLFADEVDVVVCDGFVGNIVLKTCESMGKAVGAMLRHEMTATPFRKLGAVIARGGLQALKHRMNPDVYGGAPFLGLDGNVVKIHGSARRMALKYAMLQSCRAISGQLNEVIVREIAKSRELVHPSPSSPSSPNHSGAHDAN
jgi:glycerol-3-phosphate acyltransferase PlsX